MNLPFVLDVAIGLIFIFLILSLLASEIQELLTTLLQWRASHLKDSIEVLLAGGAGTQQEESIHDIVNKLYDDPLIKNINQEAKGLAGKVRSITRWLIPGNQKDKFFGTNRTTGPSYIAPETFATSLLERLGLATLARKLIEVRLQKFATRVIGIYNVRIEQRDDGSEDRIITIPPDQDPELRKLWNKGRIRLIAEKAKRYQLDQDRNFQILVEEFDDILNDFKTGETNLVTSVERMGESLSTYIANYPLPKSSSEKDSTTDSQLNETIGKAGEHETDPLPLPQDDNVVYFAKRLIAFKRGMFGEKSERAVASGGLRPSLLELAELVNQSSSTYREVADAYQELVTAGQALDELALPRLKEKLLTTHVEVLEQQLAANHLVQIETQLRMMHPRLVQPFEKKLGVIGDRYEQAVIHAKQPVRRRRGLMRRTRTWLACQWRRNNSSTPRQLHQQRQRIITEIFDRLSENAQQEITIAVLNQLTPQELKGDVANGEFGLIDRAFDQLTNEEQQLIIDSVLSDISDQEQWDEEFEKKQRSLYENYQSYKTTQQILAKLPNSVKESFAILARRAQTTTQQATYDINQFREEVAVWFDRSMSRASGVYKRNAKGVAILIGLLLVIVTNVDAGFIVARLSNDESLRNVVAQQAASIDGQSLDDVRSQTSEALEELALPIGWNPANVTDQLGCELPTRSKDLPSDWSEFYDACLENQVNESQTTHQLNQASTNPLQSLFQFIGSLFQHLVTVVTSYPLALLRILFGWLIAGIAISMGAPFWFDLLGKIVNVRNSGGKPSSTETQSVAKSASTETPVKQP